MEIITITKDNYKEIPPVCFCKSDSNGFKAKEEWLLKRFDEGLKIKLLRDKNKTHGFIEYISGENAWRAVDAKGYNFIHCLWTYPNSVKNNGYGTLLINEVIKEGKPVAVVTSNDSFMSTKSIFIKNGFKIVEEKGKQQLLANNKPTCKLTPSDPSKYKDLTIIYTKQCPWVNRLVNELDYPLKIIELKSAKEAQNAPSIYTTFTLIKDGKILADHYISKTRFNNIIKKLKEKKI